MSKDPYWPAPSNLRTRVIAKLGSTAPSLNRMPNGEFLHADFHYSSAAAE